MSDIKRVLLLIDPQNDFCHPQGSLYVPGADIDMQRLARCINKYPTFFDYACITMDTHSEQHIANATSWRFIDQELSVPDCSQVKRRRTRTRSGEVQSRFYVLLDGRKRYVTCPELMQREGGTQKINKMFRSISNGPLTLWPNHCIHEDDGEVQTTTDGWTMQKDLHRALGTHMRKNVKLFTKGEDDYVESFSALKTEDGKPINPELLDKLAKYDEIYVAGEASSHCVRRTMESFAELRPDLLPRVKIIENCMSPVRGFEPDFEMFKNNPNFARKFVLLEEDEGVDSDTSPDFVPQRLTREGKDKMIDSHA